MIEAIIVAVLVLWSALVVFKKVFPKTSNTVFNALANACETKGWTTLAKWLKPTKVAGCSGGCGCSAAEDAPAKKTEVQAVKWK